jgi:flavin reductase (DIM6/NTAB) family NADH-FMN oxidoreductase RutF
MTVHGEHPFQGPDRDPVRQVRGRLGGVVSLWTTGTGTERAGLTVSSLMLANGDPAHVLGLVDPDSDLAGAVAATGTAVVALLQWRHRDLADAFAGVAPAPGGVFRSGTWTDTDWGPLLDGVDTWLGVRFSEPAREVGWSVLLDGSVEQVTVGEVGEGDRSPLVHRRGRYLRPGAAG